MHCSDDGVEGAPVHGMLQGELLLTAEVVGLLQHGESSVFLAKLVLECEAYFQAEFDLRGSLRHVHL